jgi:putative ABC transport system ATP-binding protein
MKPSKSHAPESGRSDGSAIALRRIEKAFGEGAARTPVLKGTCFDARPSELLMLVGPSGCGKTTLLSVMAGTLDVDSGEVEVLGQRLDRMSDGKVTRFRMRSIGFVFQSFNLIPTLTATENVSVPLLINGVQPAEAEKRAAEVLDEVGLTPHAAYRPAKLSGGQQQRVAIARAIIHNPPIILCDEPTSSLDSENGHQVMELLARIARHGRRTVVIVSHDPRIYSYADRMAEMEDGQVLRVLQSREEIAANRPLL